VEWEVLVSAAEPSDKVISEQADGALGGIVAVDIWWSQLVVNVSISEKVLEGSEGFIVQLLESWL